MIPSQNVLINALVFLHGKPHKRRIYISIGIIDADVCACEELSYACASTFCDKSDIQTWARRRIQNAYADSDYVDVHTSCRIVRKSMHHPKQK